MDWSTCGLDNSQTGHLEECLTKIWRKKIIALNVMFSNSLSASSPVRELSSPRLEWPKVGLSVNCPVSKWAKASGERLCGAKLQKKSMLVHCSLKKMTSDESSFYLRSSKQANKNSAGARAKIGGDWIKIWEGLSSLAAIASAVTD